MGRLTKLRDSVTERLLSLSGYVREEGPSEAWVRYKAGEFQSGARADYSTDHSSPLTSSVPIPSSTYRVARLSR